MWARYLAAALTAVLLAASCAEDDAVRDEGAPAEESTGGDGETDDPGEADGSGSTIDDRAVDGNGSESVENSESDTNGGDPARQVGVSRSGSVEPWVAVGEPADGAQLVDVVSIDANTDGTVMALTEEALFRVDVDPPTAVALPAAAPPGAAAVTAGPSGTAWVMSGLSGGGALYFDGEQWLGLPVDEDLQFDQNPEPPWPVAGDADENGILWSTAVVELGGWVLGPTGLVAFAPDSSWSLIDRPDGISACEGCWYDLAPDGRVWTFTESGMSRYDPTSGWTDFPFEQGSRTVLFDADNGPTPWVSSYDWSSGERITWVMDAAHPTFAPHWLRLNSSRGLATAVEGWPMDASSAPIDRACLEVEFGVELGTDAFDLDEILASPEQTIQLAGNVARGLETAPDGTAYAAFTCVGITHLLADGTADVMPASELPSPHLADLTIGPDGRVWVAGDFGVTTLG